MTDQYSIDLEKYSLEKFKKNLESRDMIPSRLVLKDDLNARFGILATSGITNLKALMDALKTKERIEQFSQKTGLTVEYLTILNREAKSYLTNPIRLDKFPGISTEYLDKLDKVGINHTRHFFNEACNRNDREQLSQRTGIPIENLNELIGMADLSRAYGVGPVFARMLYDLGIHSIQSLIEWSAADIVRMYEDQTQKKADFGVNEIEFSLTLAKELDIAIEL